MHCLELHSFSFPDSIPQFMQSFRIVWSTVSGKPDCATMDFNMRLSRLETRLEWQLEQHFLPDYSENTGMWPQTQNDTVISIMKHAFTTIPGVLWIVTAVVLFFYRLNKKRYNEIVEELKNGKRG